MHIEVNIMKTLTLVFTVLSVGLGQEDPPAGQNSSFPAGTGHAAGFPAGLGIVDGQNTLITSYPYQVSLMYNGKHICGGSIVSKYYVLTAAHCTDDNLSSKDKFSIRAGSSYQGNGGTIYLISSITQHPNFFYGSFWLDYDICIIRTSSKIIYDAYKKPISLATSLPYAGTFGVVTGWGKLDTSSSTAYQLQKLVVPIVSRKKCMSSYVNITDRVFCAGYMEGGRGTCSDDSGGPLVVGNKLIGLVSYGGSTCALENYPTVYANVPYFYNWIKSNVIFD